jgi:hypothetical protein
MNPKVRIHVVMRPIEAAPVVALVISAICPNNSDIMNSSRRFVSVYGRGAGEAGCASNLASHAAKGYGWLDIS